MIRARYFTSKDDLTALFALRQALFEGKSGLPDSHDRMAVYALGFDERDAPCATGRLFIHSDRFFIDRVGTLPALRGRGYGELVIRMLMDRAFELGAGAVYARAPQGGCAFLQKYGFEPVEGEQSLMRVTREAFLENGCRRCGGCAGGQGCPE